ncbi:heme A synthase [Streptacidiphilus sp. MAP12-33]|uniref:DUF2568 domain-containing protein n=1 Tax=Streptacidiphilus sp. MAP12-33 TaxID=3156266 RepID=UPI003517F73B
MSMVVDVLGFAAELAVYAAAIWWAWTLRRPRVVRLAVAVVALVLLAAVWGEWAAPTAAHPLHGAGRAAFEICWFGAGALAALRAWNAERARRQRDRC